MKAKRIMAAVAAILLLGTACSKVPDTPAENPGNDTAGTTSTTASETTAATPTQPIDKSHWGQIVPSDYVVTISGTELRLRDEVEPLLTSLGEPTEIVKSEMAGGYWIEDLYTYLYPSFTLSVVTDNGVNKLDSIHLTSDAITLNKGITVGVTREELYDAYGQPTYEDNMQVLYASNLDHAIVNGEEKDIDYRLYFSFDNDDGTSSDVVRRITITSDYYLW